MTAAHVIGPALMGGLVKDAGQAWIKIHLHGCLGVITVPRSLALTEETLLPGMKCSSSSAIWRWMTSPGTTT